MRAFSWLLLAIWMTLSASAQLAGTNTTVRLIFSASEVKAGDEVVAAFQFRMNEGWHTYWQNAGESGKPIEISWKLPTGIEAGPIQWPVPEKIDTGGIFTYGYHGEATLLVPLRVAANVPAGEHRIEAELNWLECADVCLPADTNLVGSIRVGFETKSSSSLAVFDQARAKLPKDGKPLKLIAQWVAAPKGDEQDLWLEFTPNVSGGTWDFYPFASEEMELAGMTTNEPSAGTKLRLRKTAKRLGQDWPKQIAGLLVHAAKPGAAPDSGYEVRATILRPGMELSSGGLEPKPAVGTTPTSIWGMLVAAFVGGLILNIMPCVLPVISLKILGFVQQTGEGKGRARRLGFIYALGVLTSFMILAGVIIAVKAAGGNAIWGMQFQNPIFIVSLITLVLLVALNLFGV
ncbi:MAG TPA: protein-disulfide reductase DsbD domain-containing protein, partial [Methylomirabilota bacterium]|nr:protein-disulfide reductase DsbD domain-containing protein [Methylomirabilota bacterium]